MAKRIIIDGTPLLGSSGHRGIGRVIYDLLHGLEETRDEWRGDLDIRVVTSLGVLRQSLMERLGEAAEQLNDARGRSGKDLVLRRRLFLDDVALSARADLLHLTEALGTPLRTRVPRVITVHDLIPLRLPEQYLRWGPQRWTRKPIEHRRYHAAKRLVAISELTRNDLVSLLGIPRDTIDVVPNGIDLRHWSPQRGPADRERLSALGLRRPYVVYAGYWDRRKDVPTMLRAIAEARRTTDVEFVWAGKFTARDLKKLRAYLRSEGVLDELPTVRFVGYVSSEDLAVLYRNALAHLFVSRLEGFGISVAEAMASGCPVIVANGSGADEVGGDAVMKIDPGDHAAAARAIGRLANDPTERVRLTAAGLSRARVFDRATMARGYVNVWRQVK